MFKGRPIIPALVGIIQGVCALLLTLPLYASWMPPEDAPTSFVERTIDIKVHPNGTYSEKRLFRLRINNDQGRSEGTQLFTYSPSMETLKITAATVENGGITKPVPPTDIVDSQVANTEYGLQESHQITISFPEVQIGSILSVEYLSENLNPPFENHFVFRVAPGQGSPDENLRIHIESPRKLFTEISNGAGVLEFQERTENGNFIYDFHNLKTIFHSIINEEKSINPVDKIPIINLSTAETQADLLDSLITPYEEILSEATPETYFPIIDQAKTLKSQEEQLNYILAELSSKLRYMGDWRNFANKKIPHSLASIATRGQGDCKDMAATLVNILRNLNYEAHVALIYRDREPVPLPKIGISNANHAIVAVKDKEHPDRYLWLDPTVTQAFAYGVFEDIAEREAVILKSPRPEIVYVPYHEAELNFLKTSYWLSLKNKEQVLKTEIDLSGTPALSLIGKELSQSQRQIENKILSSFITSSPVIDFKFNPFSLKEKVVSPIHFSAEVRMPFTFTLTSQGKALRLPTPPILKDIEEINPKSRRSDFSLGVPLTRINERFLENLQILGDENLDCHIQSPWLDLDINLNKSNEVVARYEMRIKKSRITAEEIATEEFKSFREQVMNCNQPRYFIIKIEEEASPRL